MGDKIYELEKNLLKYHKSFEENTKNFDVEYNIKDDLDEEYRDEIQETTLQNFKFLLWKEEKLFYERREKLIKLIQKTEKTIKKTKDEDAFFNENSIKNEVRMVKFEKYDELFYFKFPELSSVQQDKKQKADNYLDRFISIEIEKIIENYQREKGYFKLLNQYTIIFLHHYTKDKAGMIDTDNFNIKKPIDAVNGRLLKNDTVSNSHICQFTVFDSENYTEMIIFPGHEISKKIMNFITEKAGGKTGELWPK